MLKSAVVSYLTDTPC